MRTISSAAPVSLARYAQAGHAAATRLENEARRLEAALAQLHSRCTEYRVPESEGLAVRLLAGSRDTGELAAWVEGVAAAFRAADAGALSGPTADLFVPRQDLFPGIPSSWDETPLVSAPKPPAERPRPQAPSVSLALLQAAVALLWGRPAAALLALAPVAVREALVPAGRLMIGSVAEGLVDVELERAFQSLNEALAQALIALGETGEERARDLAQRLLAFDRRWRWDPMLAGQGPAFNPVSQALAWNGLAASLLGQLTLLESSLNGGPAALAVAPTLASVLGPGLVLCGFSIVGLSVVGGAPSWPYQAIEAPGDVGELIQRSFWNQGFRNIDPQLLRQLGARLDALNLQLSQMSGPGAAVESNHGTLKRPTNTVYGAYAAISYEPGEQVVLEQLNADGDYRLSIAGLDPNKPGAPNNFEAVMLTGYFGREQNHYYQYVRERFFAALAHIPPGSELHLQGHSMGGGMCLLLREDPEVQRRLREAGISVPSLTIYGAVVPTHASLTPVIPADSPFANTAFRAYVHTSDSLALNVGAGYEGYADVQMIGGLEIDAPAHAHTGYDHAANYKGLPPELLTLPYVVDLPNYDRMIPVPPAMPSPYAPIEEPPAIAA